VEDVVAVEMVVPPLRHYFMTWGRVFDPPSGEAELLTAVTAFAPAAIGETASDSRICDTLRSASNAPYFYEGLLSFAQRAIPYGDEYANWRLARRAAIQQGREIYYLGSI
jgi:hypothetical protein